MADKKSKAEEEAQKQGPIPATVVFQAAPPEPEDDLSDEEFKRLSRKLLLSQLRTAEMQEDIALQAATKHQEDKRSVEQRREDAQNAIKAQIAVRENAKKVCRHKQGGFGLEQTLKGDGKTALVQAYLPIPGHRYITCVRCEGEWRNPQPSLRRTDPERYARELADFEKLWDEASDGNNRPIDVPRFAIERDGLPVQVDLK